DLVTGALRRIRARDRLPGLVHGNDDALAVQERDVRGKRVDDRLLPCRVEVAQLLLRAPQEERSPVAVGDRVHFAQREVLETLAGLVKLRDQRRHFLVGVGKGRCVEGSHAAMASGSSRPSALRSGCLWLSVPTILWPGAGATFTSVGV